MVRDQSEKPRLGVASRYDLNKKQASRLVQAETLAFNFDVAGRYAEQRDGLVAIGNSTP